jgi:CRISPR-associated Csh1 family protein
MLQTIALIGKAMSQDFIKDIVDRTNAKDVFVIKLDKECRYMGLIVENNEGEERYLYKREKGGLPGKFLTGRIGSLDMRNLKKSLHKSLSTISAESGFSSEVIDKFKKNKVSWVKKSGIMKNIEAIKKIPSENGNLLKAIVNEIISQQDQIMNDISDKVLNGDYRDILLTVKVDSKYLADIEGFPELLQIASQGEDESLPSLTDSEFNNSSITSSRCINCGAKASTSQLKEPLPFFTIDKPNFIPGGVYRNFTKAFPLCRPCYLDLQRGSRYIQDKLCFDIPNTSGRSRLWFWLIPQLNDPSLLEEGYIKKNEKGFASFKYMLGTSEQLDYLQEIDLPFVDDKDIRSNVLTYMAIFHHYDQQKHMRLIAAVDGIYPSRFKELSEEKYIVDKIAFRTGNPNKFYFGLITDFLEKDNEGWLKTMAHIMACIFTGKQLNETQMVKLLLAPLKSTLSKRQLQDWLQIILKATLILEYLHRVSTLPSSPDNNHNIEPKIRLKDEKASSAARFLGSHAGILYTKNLRAICAIGIAVGVIIKVQQRFLGSDSFISRLNRLEMDYTRLLGLYPQTLIKLRHYKAYTEFDRLFTYLGSNEISNLDPRQEIQKDLMNMVFAIGMAHGFILGEKV